MPALPPSSIASDIRHYLSGLLMGAADIVPGVSGGTVALLLGIYERLLSAISGIGPKSVSAVFRGRWREAATMIDLRFLVALAAGIATGIVSLAHLMQYLLTERTQLTMSLFFGLIAASGVLVIRLVRTHTSFQTGICLALGIAAALLAGWVVTTDALKPHEGLGYYFICGAVAICAMILPGISGAYILLLMGRYEQITFALKEFVGGLLHGRFESQYLLTIGVFVAGCATGLVLFSRVLKWLLAQRPSETMSLLAGFMIGSLVKIWPFQAGGLDQPADPLWPPDASPHTLACLALAVGAALFVFAVDWLARRR
jgi:putative membrane protein